MPGHDPDRPSRTSPAAAQVVRPRNVQGRSLAALAGTVGAKLADARGGQTTVTGITHDSRQVRPGDLYAALPGAHAHGASFAAEAIAGGATAVVTDPDGGRLIAEAAGPAGGTVVPTLLVGDARAAIGPLASEIYGDPSSRLRLLGVTGTNGKTTTSYLLEAGLRAAGHRTGLIGTVETKIADHVLRSVRTTPEAPDLQALLAVMAQDEVTAAAMEVSSHALALRRIDGTNFRVVGFTNLSQDHLDFHADLDDYFAAKARLFTAAFAATGVVNVDDEHGRRLVAEMPIRAVTVSARGHRDADWRASDIEIGPAGSRARVQGPDVDTELGTRLRGGFNLANALLALAMLVEAGIEPAAAARGIEALAQVPGRMEPVDAGQPFGVLVDYAHTPDAVETLLETVRATASGRVIVVLGCGGDRDRAKRPLMGAAAARLADIAVLTSDNPRDEEPAAILDAVVGGAHAVAATERGEIVVELDRGAAIATAIARAKPGDVVVVAGKGHEQGQEVAGVVHPFDDRAVVREQLLASGWQA